MGQQVLGWSILLAGLHWSGNAGADPLQNKCCGFGFSARGPIAGMNCKSVNEPSDPDTWADNYFCGPNGLDFRWVYGGANPAGMKCTAIQEGSEPPEHTWGDNRICIPNQAPYELRWSMAGPVEEPGFHCVQWLEPSDPHTWNDNFLCARPSPFVTGPGVATFPLVGGSATSDEPAIGRFFTPSGGACTATLVGRRLAVTAAHCVDYETQMAGNNASGTLELTNSTTKSKKKVVRYQSFGTDVGANDVAILILDSCPSGTFKPLPLADRFPHPTEEVRIFGFGCSSRSSFCNHGPGPFIKQVVTEKIDQTKVLCPGDSGGPALLDGKVAAINSGSNCDTGVDIFANPTGLGARIAELAALYPCTAPSNGCPPGQRRCPKNGQCMTPVGCAHVPEP